MSDVASYRCMICDVIVSSGHVCAMSAIQARIDTLTAERDEARREFTEWLDASRKALDTHAEVVADRDRLAACVERVRKVTRVKIGVGPYPDRDYTEVVHVSDILAALGRDG
jgi:hypothetical protein